MSNEVDFAFQGDVINLGSLTHMLTGRVLKALSDGKVDIYAVGAAFWLGARVPIRSSLADTVHAHVAQRRGYQSVLSKALSIGWGHSTPVVEMTRTRAGTNALLLVGALTTGATPFQAAQCLSELLTIYGISLERLPSVDVLKELAAYLTPFVYDLGFSKVLQHITDVVEGSLEAEILSQSANGGKPDRQPLWEVRHLGSASALAGAIKQLIYTSENRQDHYMVLKMRGSWLPAFASHLLGMSVELRCHGKLLWACGGDKGSVTFQLGKHPIDKFSIQPSSTPQMVIESPETSHQDIVLAIDYSIGDAVEAILAKRPEISPDIAMAIHNAIHRMSRRLFARLCEGSTGFPHKWNSSFRRYQTTGGFDNMGALETVFRALSIQPNQQQSAESFPRQIRIIDVRRGIPVERVHDQPDWSTPSSSSSSSALASPSSSRSPSPVPLPPWPSPPIRAPEPPITRVQSTSLPQASTLATQSEPDPSVAESSEESFKLEWRAPGSTAMGPASHGLTYMARDQVLRLASSCDLHQSDVSLVADTMIDDPRLISRDHFCICEQIGAIIHNTSIVALALAHCKFDPLELRIPEASLTQRQRYWNSWGTEFLPSYHKYVSGRVAMFDGKISDKLIEYLAEVFLTDHSDELTEQAMDKDGLDKDWWQLLGISGGTYTIHYSCIMENDCYDDFGRIINIRTGRASVEGSFRNFIGENTVYMDIMRNPMKGREQTMAPSLLAGGSLLQPHYRPSKTRIFMDVTLHETVIELGLQADSTSSRNRRWGFKRCLVALLSGVTIPSCEHGLNSAYVVNKDREVAVEGFHMARFTGRSSDQVLVLALQGNKLEQVLACDMLMRELEEEQVGKNGWEPGQDYSWWKQGVLQTSSCLECCIRLSQTDDKCLPWVIIGG